MPAPREDEPDAAVFCKDDLTINGGGTLIVNGRYRNGIASKDNLVVTGGDIRITAAHDALRGRDSLAVSSGTFTIDAGADGVKSNNDEDTEKGWISLDGGVFAITAGNDGIQAETVLQINLAAIIPSIRAAEAPMPAPARTAAHSRAGDGGA